MNQSLGNTAIQEIRKSMRNLAGKPAKNEAVRLAAIHNVSWQRIYKLTEDLRPQRKKRADAGKRTYELIEGTDVWKAAQLVIVDKLDPDQALRVIKLRDAEAKLPSLEYFQRILRENHLGKKQRRLAKRSFRRWEASAPGEIFQVDVTALKVRWEDEKTRRILRIEGVDKNHPNMDATKLRVWQIMLVDDFTRRRFFRYVATTHITSRDMVQFECEAFQKLGIPHVLYTDNGSEFKGFHIRAEKILNKVLEHDGGYRHLTHAPGNSQASGKVEVAHKWAEKMDRLVGLAVTEGQIVTLDDLNVFADRVCVDYDNRVNRSTGQTPLMRWHSKAVIVRKLPAEVIESALMSDEFEVVLDGSMTVAHKGTAYKVPGVIPFVNFIGQKVKVVVPPSIDLILMTLPDGGEYELEKVLATANTAGEFKANAEGRAEDLTKRLKASRKEEVKAIKAKRKLTGQVAPVPHYNVEMEQPATNITHFPQAERVFTAEEVNEVTPIATPVTRGREINYWEAVGEFGDRFDSLEEAKIFLRDYFPDDSSRMPKLDVEAAVERRNYTPQQGFLRAV